MPVTCFPGSCLLINVVPKQRKKRRKESPWILRPRNGPSSSISTAYIFDLLLLFDWFILEIPSDTPAVTFLIVVVKYMTEAIGRRKYLL